MLSEEAVEGEKKKNRLGEENKIKAAIHYMAINVKRFGLAPYLSG